MASPAAKPVNIFISYSGKDSEVVEELRKNFAVLEKLGKITIFSDAILIPGDKWAVRIEEMLLNADILLLPVSAHSLASENVTREMMMVVEKAERKKTRIVPLMLSHCNWQNTPLANYQFLINPEQPLSNFWGAERAKLFTDIVNSLDKLVNSLNRSWQKVIEREMEEKTGKLNLSDCNLYYLPSELAEMNWLTSLDLSYNGLDDIALLSELTKLEWLKLDFNNIADIVPLSGLTNLRTLNLSHNQIRINDSILPIAPNVEVLDLSYNGLLEYLNLPTLYNLKDLTCSHNSISFVFFPTNLPALTTLDISYNKLGDETKLLPDYTGLHNLPQLSSINLSNNRFIKIPPLAQLTTLTYLQLGENAIEKIEGLDTLTNLEYLDLFGNQIAVIENLQQNKKLKLLGLSQNNISKLENISHLQQLETLYIAHNQIEDITELQNLKALKRCVLTANRIVDVFPLKEFIENDIPVQDTYSFDDKEPGFFIKDNPIQYPPLEVIAQGKDAILRNFTLQEKSLTEQLQPYQSAEVKLILLGNANVGKSHIATYIKSKRKKLPPNNASTHGMVNEFASYNQPGMPRAVRMRILDFGGQEYYHDTHHLFFTNDTIYLLLWEKESNRFGVKAEKRYSDKTKQHEEETNAVFPVAYWLDAVNYFINKKEEEKKASANYTGSIDPSVILVETKRDKKGAHLLDTESIKQFSHLVHSQAAISLYADAAGKIVSTGADALFDSLNDLAGRMFEKTWPGYYGLVTAFFDSSENAETTKLHKQANADGLIVGLQQCIVLFNSIIKSKGYKYKFDNDNALDLCRYLANRGYILYFDESRICLHPEKLTKEIYQLLNSEYNNRGIILQSEIKTADPAVSSIMQDFKLIIPHPAANGFIAPQLLPESTGSQLAMFLDAFKPPVIRFSLTGYIHKNIIQELFYSFKNNLVKEDTQNYIWKNGFVIKIDNELYKINISSTENCRRIEIQYLTVFNKRLLLDISSKIAKVLEGRAYTKEVSNDGDLFVNVSLLQSNKRLSQFVFGDKLLRVADYKNFFEAGEQEHAMKKLFISYSSKNTDFMKRFVTHLEPLKRNGDIDFWHDRMIEPGSKWDESIKKELVQSDIIIFLLSPDFIATNYIFEVEIPAAIQQAGIGAKLFFVELQACSWNKTVLADYQQTTDPAANNKGVIQIGEPQNDTQWKLVIDELEKLLK